MTEKPLALVELDDHDRRRTRRERLLVVAIIGIGLAVSLLVGHEIAAADDDVRSIKCEQGDVVLVLERAGGQYERVECPAGAEVKP